MDTESEPQEIGQTPLDRAQAISRFARDWLGDEHQDLYQEMLLTVCRLAADGVPRGDLKLLHRALAELRYGFKVFAPYRETPKISIFGSSRTPEWHPDYEAAVEFSRRIRAAGWMVITGAGDGIMKAGHGGAGREASFGVAIRLPFEQRTNDIIARDPKLVNFRYFFTRKLMFLKEASAVALFPGGFGTQDEGFEALTLVQTGKSALVPIVMCERPGGKYWPRWCEYVRSELLGNGMISEPDMSLFRITDNVDDAVAEVVRFYRVYHSSRYVHEDFILRMRRDISESTLERINDEFCGKLTTKGRIERVDPHPLERGEYADLPRLRVHFDRKNHGILRQMVEVINADPAE